MGTMGQLEDWTNPSGKLGEITAEFIMLRALGGGNREAVTADTKADSVAWETWVRTKDARRAVAAERARIRRELLERVAALDREAVSRGYVANDEFRHACARFAAEIDRICPEEG